jgi:hypothetical protein
MQKIYAEIKSMDDLAKEGFKFSESNGYAYTGNNRWPTYKIHLALFHTLGKKLPVVGLEKPKWSKEAKVVCDDGLGNQIEIPAYLVKNKLKIPKLQSLKLKDHYDEATFSGMQFKFPCDWKRLTQAEAIQVANWILKAVKK